jgi:Protein kinase domain
MDETVLIERLRRAGATAAGLATTIRPQLVVGVTDETVAAPPPGPREAGEDLPTITIDRRITSSQPDAAPSADLVLVKVLGEGGMGCVHLARQRSLQRPVAVKTTHEDAPFALHQALIAEAVITGQLEHPSIVPIHALGVDAQRRPALVMKRVEGVGWDVLLDEPSHEVWEGWEGTESDRLAGHLQILKQVCHAVHFAHSRGVVHRDLKPENVLIGRFGDVYVADWGVAIRMADVADSGLCGTPGYMAPEMVVGEDVDARTDVYLLGAVLNRVLVGRVRHDAERAIEALRLALVSAPQDFDEGVPLELATLINRACHLDPDRRPPSAEAFREGIVRFEKHRVSVRLAEGAMTRLVEVQAMHDEGAADEESERSFDELVAQARFGLRQALDDWPENPDAREAFAELEAILEARRARKAHLERFARERDPGIGAGHRIRALNLLALAGVALGVGAWMGARAASPLTLVLYATGVAVPLVVLTFVFRDDLLATAFGRQTSVMLFLCLGVTLLPRLLGLWFPVELDDALVRDSMGLAGVTAMGSFTLFRWLIPVTATLLLTALAIMVWPPLALPLFGTGSSLGLVLCAWFARREAVSRSGD